MSDVTQVKCLECGSGALRMARDANILYKIYKTKDGQHNIYEEDEIIEYDTYHYKCFNCGTMNEGA